MPLQMTPEQVEAVAANSIWKCSKAASGRVGESHYLHHDRDGRPYANIAELAERSGAASAETGIGLTLLPVFYAHDGFGGGRPARRADGILPLAAASPIHIHIAEQMKGGG